jgi:hypothetical protein
MLGFLCLILILIFFYNISYEKRDEINYILILFFLLIVSNQLLLVEEEIILIIIILFLLDAGGGFVKEVVWGLLDHKAYLIEIKLEELYELKHSVLSVVSLAYQARIRLSSNFFNFYFYYLNIMIECALLLKVVNNVINELNIERIDLIKVMEKLLDEMKLVALSWVMHTVEDYSDYDEDGVLSNSKTIELIQLLDSNYTLLDEEELIYFFYLENINDMYEIVGDEDYEIEDSAEVHGTENEFSVDYEVIMKDLVL